MVNKYVAIRQFWIEWAIVIISQDLNKGNALPLPSVLRER